MIEALKQAEQELATAKATWYTVGVIKKGWDQDFRVLIVQAENAVEAKEKASQNGNIVLWVEPCLI